jgi:hypothetical protein
LYAGCLGIYFRSVAGHVLLALTCVNAIPYAGSGRRVAASSPCLKSKLSQFVEALNFCMTSPAYRPGIKQDEQSTFIQPISPVANDFYPARLQRTVDLCAFSSRFDHIATFNDDNFGSFAIENANRARESKKLCSVRSREPTRHFYDRPTSTRYWD